MRFTLHRLINLDERKPINYAEFHSAFGESKIIPYSRNNTDYVFTVHLTEDYCFVEVKYGSTEANDCFDKTENLFKKDILSKNVTHTDEQFFIFTNFNSDAILLSDNEKKGVLVSYLKDHGYRIKAYDIANDINKFSDNIKKFSSVKLKLTNNIFLQDYFSTKFNDDWDNTLPETCDIKLHFNCKLEKDTIKRKFNDFKSDCSIDEFEFEGEDDENRVLVINKKAFIMKQDVEVIKSNDGYYDAKEVERKLLEINK